MTQTVALTPTTQRSAADDETGLRAQRGAFDAVGATAGSICGALTLAGVVR